MNLIYCPTTDSSVRGSADESTLPDRLSQLATEVPDRTAYTFLSGRQADELSITYSELHQAVNAMARQLLHDHPGHEKAVLMYEPGLDFIKAFFACLYAGIVAVPINPPHGTRHAGRLDAVMQDSGATLVLTSSTTPRRAGVQAPGSGAQPGSVWVETDTLSLAAGDWVELPAAKASALALLQYTSGSTATPKGVQITHRNIMANQRMIRAAFEHDAQSVVVGWLPHYHDMGLIGNILQPVYVGCRCILMSPMYFLQQPLRWLQAISKYRATTSGGPNFAYDLCARELDPDNCAGLDLSTWSLAFCGAERVHPETLARFERAFSPAGFRRKAFYPCYGLAEATLMATGGLKAARPVVRRFDKVALEQNLAKQVLFRRRRTVELTGCGTALPGEELVIVDPQTLRPCLDEHVGEIWISGANVSQGYWQRPDENRDTFAAFTVDSRGPFFRTGDLGFLQKGELFVTGRMKELIIIRGQNIFPNDIELHVSTCDPELRPLSCIAFSIDVQGEEQLVILAESNKRRMSDRDRVIAKIQQTVVETYGIRADHIDVLDPLRLPRTSSGKLQRLLCKKSHLEGLAAVASAAPEAASAVGADRTSTTGSAAKDWAG